MGNPAEGQNPDEDGYMTTEEAELERRVIERIDSFPKKVLDQIAALVYANKDLPRFKDVYGTGACPPWVRIEELWNSKDKASNSNQDFLN